MNFLWKHKYREVSDCSSMARFFVITENLFSAYCRNENWAHEHEFQIFRQPIYQVLSSWEETLNGEFRIFIPLYCDYLDQKSTRLSPMLFKSTLATTSVKRKNASIVPLHQLQEGSLVHLDHFSSSLILRNAAVTRRYFVLMINARGSCKYCRLVSTSVWLCSKTH